MDHEHEDNCPHCKSDDLLISVLAVRFSLQRWRAILLNGAIVAIIAHFAQIHGHVVTLAAVLATLPLAVECIRKRSCLRCGLDVHVKPAPRNPNSSESGL